MTSRNGWQRVSKSRPCPICKRPDWCLIATDGSAAICPRVESSKLCGEAGWLHRLRDDRCWPQRPQLARAVCNSSTPALPDLAKLASGCQAAVNPRFLDGLARSLGLSVESLTALSIGWSSQYRAWTFPMVDSGGNVLGIRLRRPNGFKFAVSGERGLPMNTLDRLADYLELSITMKSQRRRKR